MHQRRIVIQWLRAYLEMFWATYGHILLLASTQMWPGPPRRTALLKPACVRLHTIRVYLYTERGSDIRSQAVTQAMQCLNWHILGSSLDMDVAQLGERVAF